MSNDYRPEIYRLLHIGDPALSPESSITEKPEPVASVASSSSAAAANMPSFGGVPLNLPVVDFAEEQKPLADRVVDNILSLPIKEDARVSNGQMALINSNASRQSIFSTIKKLFVYPVIFIVSFAFFYVLLNFSSLVGQVGAWFNSGSEDQEILKEDLNDFYTWMGGYYFAVQNKELLEPANDIDKDGLSNMDEFIIRTNPTIADSDLDESSDGYEIINFTNPWGKGEMTSRQRDLREKLDVIKINNRMNFNTVSLTTSAPAEPTIAYDLSRAGTLSIPRLNLQVPLVWTKDPKDFDSDLTKGVVHYPGTALPGQTGVVYISGHSSDYLWKKHPYKQVFARINTLEAGDDIFIDVYGLDGKLYNYRYKVTAENVYKPDDQTQFIDTTGAKLNLSTCWPIGTQRDRYVVTASLIPL